MAWMFFVCNFYFQIETLTHTYLHMHIWMHVFSMSQRYLLYHNSGSLVWNYHFCCVLTVDGFNSCYCCCNIIEQYLFVSVCYRRIFLFCFRFFFFFGMHCRLVLISFLGRLSVCVRNRHVYSE